MLAEVADALPLVRSRGRLWPPAALGDDPARMMTDGVNGQLCRTKVVAKKVEAALNPAAENCLPNFSLWRIAAADHPPRNPPFASAVWGIAQFPALLIFGRPAPEARGDGDRIAEGDR